MVRTIVNAGLVVGLACLFACGRSGTAKIGRSVSSKPSAEIVALHDSLITEIIAVKNKYGHWSFVVGNGDFAWGESVFNEVIDFILRPDAAQLTIDDLAENFADEDRSLANLQIMYIALSAQAAFPDKFCNLDGSLYVQANRDGRFDPIIKRNPDLGLRTFFDFTTEKLGQIQAKKSKFSS